MSATIGDPADLSRRLGTEPIAMVEVDPALGGDTLGRRLIVLDPDEEQMRTNAALSAALQTRDKSLWLCTSRSQVLREQARLASLDQQLGLPPAPQWAVSRTGDEVDQFRAAASGHLFAAARYDGMDFRDDECRLVVVVPTLPRATNAQEEFIAQQLGGGGVISGRLNARIVQALGRANRSDDDYAVYLLADPRFAGHFVRESYRETLPSDVNIEVDLAQDLSEQDPQDVADCVSAFLAGDFGHFDRERASAKKYGAPVSPPAPDWSEPLARAEIDGWHALWRGEYTTAERDFSSWSEICAAHELPEMSAFAKWCAAKAAFLAGEQGDQAAAVRSKELPEAAIGHGGRFTTWFNDLRHSLHAMRAETVPESVIADGAREQICERSTRT